MKRKLNDNDNDNDNNIKKTKIDYNNNNNYIKRETLYNIRVYGNREYNNKFEFLQKNIYNKYIINKGNGILYTCDKEINTGKKKFILKTLNGFYKLIKKTNKEKICFYEMCPDEKYNKQLNINYFSSINLYADVEIYCNSNKQYKCINDYDNEKHIYLNEINNFICDVLNINNNDIEMIEIDSSKENIKISRHYIWKIKNIMFYSNIHVGALFRRFERFIINKYGDPKSNDNIFYFWKDNKIKSNDSWVDKTFFLDMGVYTINRQIRTIYSTKIGQNRYFKIYDDNNNNNNNNDNEIKLDLLIKTSILCPFKEGSEYIKIIKLLEWNNTNPISTSHLNAHRQIMYRPTTNIFKQRVKSKKTINNNNDDINNNNIVYEDNDNKEEEELNNFIDYKKIIKNSKLNWNISKKNIDNISIKKITKPNFIIKLGKYLFNELITPHIKKQMNKYNIKNNNNIDFGIYKTIFNLKYLQCSFQTKSHYCPIKQKDTNNKSLFHNGNNSIFCIDLKLKQYWYICHGCKVLGNDRIFRKSDMNNLSDDILKPFINDINILINEIEKEINIDLNDLIKSFFF